MTQSENTLSTTQLLATKAKAISIGIFGPFTEAAAKVAQIVGFKLGSNLSKHDQAVIDQYYRSKHTINAIVLKEGNAPMPATHAGEYGAPDKIAA